MTGQIINNFIVIGVTLLILLLLGLILNRIWGELEKIIDLLALKISRNFSFKYSLVVSEVLALFAFALLWITMKNGISIWMAINILGILVFSSTTVEFRSKVPESLSIVKYLVQMFNDGNYATSCFVLFMEQLVSVMWLLFAFEFTFIVFSSLKWPQSYYFIPFVAIPIYINIWIYFKYKLDLNNEGTITIRRIIAYVVFALYIFSKTYNEFSALIQEMQTRTDITDFLLSSTYIVFFAIERLLKAWTDDYKKYKSMQVANISVLTNKHSS